MNTKRMATEDYAAGVAETAAEAALAQAVPKTAVAEVPDGATMAQLRATVNVLARIVSGAATALACMVACGASPLEDIPGTNLVYTAAEADAAIAAATNGMGGAIKKTEGFIATVYGSESPAGTGPGAVPGGASAFGMGTKATGSRSTAIGNQAEASSTASVAIGFQAKSYANHAMQLGNGTNEDEGTLKFRNYRLLNSDGTIPAERLSGVATTNDLPQNVAASRILLKGEDGKTWKLWVNSASEFKITEVE